MHTNIQQMPISATLFLNPKRTQLGGVNAHLQVVNEFVTETIHLPISLLPEQLLLIQNILKEIEAARVKFTKQEKAVLLELKKGSTYKQIAKLRFVSESTVRTQVHSIYGKLGVHSRTEALNLVFGY